MSAIVPRVRGNAIQIGKAWIYEIYVSIGEDEPIVLRFDKQPYISREAALDALRERAVDVMKETCAALGAPMPEELIDLNRGRIVSKEQFIKRKKP